MSQLVKDPVYLQLHRALRDLLRKEHARRGDRFLTERDVSARFGVSRATANKALSSLVAEGVLEFKKGVGTFVSAEALHYDLRALVSFTDKAIAAGRIPSTDILEFTQVLAADLDPLVKAALQPAPQETIDRITRVRRADGTPVILEHRFVRARFCPAMTATDLSGSLYALWTERYGLVIAGADERIAAVSLSEKEAQRLGVPAYSAGLEIISVGYLESGDSLWWERTLYRGDAYELHNRLGPVQTAGPAAGMLREPTQPLYPAFSPEETS